MSDQISIIGAGLVGSLLGLTLQKKGFTVQLFEKREDPRKSAVGEGRSINLALSRRGILPLKAAGIFEKIEPFLIPMHGRMMHDPEGNRTIQPYGKKGQYINSVSRSRLNKLLIEAAEGEGVKIAFNHQCETVDFESSTIHFENGESSKSALIIATDGAFSAVRKHMQLTDRFNFSQHYVAHGYKELNIDPVNGEFALEPNYLHIWPRGNFMLIALPNSNKTFTCTLFFPFEGEVSFERMQHEEQISALFETHFRDVCDLIPDLTQQFISNPTSSLVTTKCAPWYKDRTILMGDAAHAIVPFYGQGMNSGFEDVRLFTEMGERLNFDWDKVLTTFSKTRKKDADAISELALQNFTEMRDHVGDDEFLKRKTLEGLIQEAYPEDWIPQYSMVTFSDLPYSEALRLGKIQKKILDEYSDDANIDFKKIIERFNTLKKDD